MFAQQPHMPPQARVDGVGRLAVGHPIIRTEIPDGLAIFIGDYRVGQSTDKAPVRKIEIAAVLDWKLRRNVTLRDDRRIRGWLGILCPCAGGRYGAQ